MFLFLLFVLLHLILERKSLSAFALQQGCPSGVHSPGDRERERERDTINSHHNTRHTSQHLAHLSVCHCVYWCCCVQSLLFPFAFIQLIFCYYSINDFTIMFQFFVIFFHNFLIHNITIVIFFWSICNGFGSIVTLQSCQ